MVQNIDASPGNIRLFLTLELRDFAREMITPLMGPQYKFKQHPVQVAPPNPSIILEGHITSINAKCSRFFTLESIDGTQYPCIAPIGYEAVLNMRIKGSCLHQVHPRYGSQFEFIGQPEHITETELSRPTVIKAFIKALKGHRIGDATANRLYDHLKQFGDPSIVLHTLAVEPDQTKDSGQLLTLLTLEQRTVLFKWWVNNWTRVFLLNVGVPASKVNKMSNEEIKACMENPFTCYALKIECCVALCKIIKRHYTDNEIVAGTIARTIRTGVKKNCWTHVLFRYFTPEELSLDVQELLRNDHHITVFKDQNGPSYAFEYVIQQSDQLANYILSRASQTYPLSDWQPNEELTDEQNRAVLGALTHGVYLVTGGAGVGKTTVLGKIVSELEARGKTYVVTAFTGKAVERIRAFLKTEPAIKRKEKPLAFTMHMLIIAKNFHDRTQWKRPSYDDYDNENDYKNDWERNDGCDFDKEHSENIIPREALDPEYLIVDETSMVTGDLLHRLSIAFPHVRNIILIGDDEQLEPFGNWGRPFLNLLRCDQIQRTILTQNHRSTTGIINNSRLLRGSPTTIDPFIPSDDFHIETIMSEEYDKTPLILNRIEVILTQLNMPHNEIQVICPTRKLANSINEYLQRRRIGPDTKGFISGKQKYYPGDLVIMTENDYTIGVMNGESGYVSDVFTTGISVVFGNEKSGEKLVSCVIANDNEKERLISVAYKNEEEIIIQLEDLKLIDENSRSTVKTIATKSVCDLRHIKLAYALTAHKAQGSEYTAVIFVLDGLYDYRNGKERLDPPPFIIRNMIYTAITRAKKQIYCITVNDSLEKACKQAPAIRYEALPLFLEQ